MNVTDMVRRRGNTDSVDNKLLLYVSRLLLYVSQLCTASIEPGVYHIRTAYPKPWVYRTCSVSSVHIKPRMYRMCTAYLEPRMPQGLPCRRSLQRVVREQPLEQVQALLREGREAAAQHRVGLIGQRLGGSRQLGHALKGWTEQRCQHRAGPVRQRLGGSRQLGHAPWRQQGRTEHESKGKR